jgi:hypothetical protein
MPSKIKEMENQGWKEWLELNPAVKVENGTEMEQEAANAYATAIIASKIEKNSIENIERLKFFLHLFVINLSFCSNVMAHELNLLVHAWLQPVLE